MRYRKRNITWLKVKENVARKPCRSECSPQCSQMFARPSEPVLTSLVVYSQISLVLRGDRCPKGELKKRLRQGLFVQQGFYENNNVSWVKVSWSKNLLGVRPFYRGLLEFLWMLMKTRSIVNTILSNKYWPFLSACKLDLCAEILKISLIFFTSIPNN